MTSQVGLGAQAHPLGRAAPNTPESVALGPHFVYHSLTPRKGFRKGQMKPVRDLVSAICLMGKEVKPSWQAVNREGLNR